MFLYSLVRSNTNLCRSYKIKLCFLDYVNDDCSFTVGSEAHFYLLIHSQFPKKLMTQLMNFTNNSYFRSYSQLYLVFSITI